ncbi:hypothetical protein [Variovorax sp. WS11]|uniref:hypothetical protein n=1 Tax=Variovorax sp. WS11 TaxID=1105204 RepID=UPI0013DA6E56|nr:hypothetical protein [Variovorax sp. WS11]NDZ12921.1 hypothetical protein [Variovorax sp. WS11]
MIKYPIANGAGGCSIAVVDHPVFPAKPEIPDPTSDSETSGSTSDGEDQDFGKGWNPV